jgi:hypothetical protein
MIEFEDHPLADIFPLMTEGEIQDLALSIERTRQREPIVLYQGMILDGRNRYRAAKQAGLPPVTRIYDPERDGHSPLTFVMDQNLERRHLTVGQRAAAAAAALKAQEKEAKAAAERAWKASQEAEAKGQEPPEPEPKPKKKTQKEVAKQMGVSEDSVQRAKALQEADQQEFEAVAKGEKTLHEATEAAEAKQAKDLRKDSLREIAEVCGKEFADHVAVKSILRSDPEIIAFMALDDSEKRMVRPLIGIGWKVKRALAFSLDKLNASSSISDLINKAIGAGGDEFVVEINGWEISAIQIDQNPKITKTDKN